MPRPTLARAAVGIGAILVRRTQLYVLVSMRVVCVAMIRFRFWLAALTSSLIHRTAWVSAFMVARRFGGRG